MQERQFLRTFNTFRSSQDCSEVYFYLLKPPQIDSEQSTWHLNLDFPSNDCQDFIKYGFLLVNLGKVGWGGTCDAFWYGTEDIEESRPANEMLD